MMRIVVGTYEGLLYGWECPTTVKQGAKMKLTFGYSAHAECIKSVALMQAKQGKTLLSGGNDEMIKVYNVNKRVEVGSLMEQTGAITALEFFGTSHMLSGSADNSICIWRTSDWNCLHILGGHKGEVTSIAVHPSGKLCFSVARDRTLRMWNLVKGRIAYIRRLEKEANLVMLSQKGTRYALCFGTELSVFSSANAECIGTLEHTQKIHCAVFATDDYIVCGGDDKHIYIWHATGRLVVKFTHPDITSRIRCMQVVYAQGEDQMPYIILATSDGTVQIWDLAAFALGDDAAADANADVEPVSSTTLISKPRITCLTACLSSSVEGEEEAKTQQDKPVKKAKKKSAAKPSDAVNAAAPRVVVELGNEVASKKKKQNQSDSKSNKRKAGGKQTPPAKKTKQRKA